MIETLRQDVQFSIRALRRRPLFTGIAVLTLALGIGVNSAIFSMINSVLFRPLPGVAEPHELARLYYRGPQFPYGSFSYPHYTEFEEANRSFEGISAYRLIPLSFARGEQSDRVWGIIASGNYFQLLGVGAARGRLLMPGDDVEPGGHRVAVLSYGFWQNRLGGDEDIVGSEVLLNGLRFTVRGIAPEDFVGVDRIVAPALWVPMMMQRDLVPGGDRLNDRGAGWLQVVARLAEGTTFEQAQAAAETVSSALNEQRGEEARTVNVVPLSEAIIHPSLQSSMTLSAGLLFVVVSLVLLIACANLANLMLARGESRRRELSLRLALGAQGRRLLQQVMTESLLLACFGGLVGLVLGLSSAAWFPTLLPDLGRPVIVDFSPDYRVFLFTFGISIFSGLLFGLAPALQAIRVDLIPSLKGEETRGGRRWKVGSLLVISQVALSLILLVGAGLFIRSLQSARNMDPGFNTEKMLLATFDPALFGYEKPRTLQFYDQLIQQVQGLPGVQQVTLAEMVPLGIADGDQQWGVSVEGYQPEPGERMNLDYNLVGARYFETMGIPLRAGRDFTIHDNEENRRVMIVNQAMADRFWSNGAVGKRVQLGGIWWDIIAVAQNFDYNDLGEEPFPLMFLPFRQLFNSELTLHLRTTGEPLSLVSGLRERVRSLDSEMPMFNVRTLEEHTASVLVGARFGAGFLSAFGVLALVLAAVGLYGILAHMVSRRTREIGVRMALGADGGKILKSVFGYGMKLVVTGLVLGNLAAFGLTRYISGLLYGTSPYDLPAWMSVTLVMLVIAFLAILVPGVQATRVDPLAALRHE